MTNQDKLIQLVKKNISMGFTSQQIKESMLQAGWPENDIDQAINTTTGERIETIFSKLNMSWLTKKTLIIAISTLIIILIIIFVYPYIFPDPVCGNNKLEKDETSLTCCQDAGCEGDYVCENNECLPPIPTCIECQYLEDRICKSYTCCSNQDCPNNQTCESPSTKLAQCIEPIPKVVAPVNKQCSKHPECDDSNPATKDTCYFEEIARFGYCKNTFIETTQTDECSINTDCNDDNSATKDICAGTPKTCSNTNITECTGEDNYCPFGCTIESDLDCPATNSTV